MKIIFDSVSKIFVPINNGDTDMHSDEELIADRNIRIIAQALMDIIDVLCHVYGCENSYIRELGRDLLDKYGLELEEIANSGNGV